MSADYPSAIWMPSPGRFWHGRNGDKPRYIILHGTAGGTSAQAIGNWLNTQTEREPTSVHYVIGQDGQVVQLVSEADSAWGNGVLSNGHDSWWTPNPNWYTISIEHCKPNTDNSNTLSPAQQEASFLLVRHLCERWGIPKRAFNPATPHDAAVGITGHFSIDPVERAFCPGPYPWAQLNAYLQGAPMAWHKQTDGTGKDDKGHVCGQGFMTEIAARSITADGMRSETYHSGLDPVKSFLTLENGQTLTWDGHAVGYDSAHVIEGLMRQLAANQSNPAEHQALVQIKAIANGVQ